MDRVYYSKLRKRLVDRGEYFDELLFATLEPTYDSALTNKKQIENDNIIK